MPKKLKQKRAKMMSDSGDEIFGGLEYVSRGGQKLEKALDYFGVSPEGKVCLDCGASTGGFTDCLLQKGAKLVYAVDVGYGQLAWTLRKNERVITMERTNIRYVTPDMLGERPDLAVIDVSFISLAIVLPVVKNLLTEISEVLCLIKPQFEAGKGKVGKKGVVREPETHKEVLDTFIANAEKAGFKVKGITFSPIKGPKGNIEYLGWLETLKNPDNAEGSDVIDTGIIVSQSHKELA